jgi:hypothetical protein
MDHVPEAPIRLGREPLGVRPQAVDRNLNRLVAAWSSAFSRTRARDCKLRSEHRNLWHCDTCSPEIGLQHTVANRGVASQIPDPKEFAQIRPIFLPFSKMDGVESAPSEEMDNIIEARELQIERKHFYVELRENERGRFLRITEEAHGLRNSIIVPSTGVDDFTATIAEVLTNNEGAPA